MSPSGSWELLAFWRGIMFSTYFVDSFSLLASLGFLAFRLLVGLCSFWWLWLFASSAFPAFWLLHPLIGFWFWLPASSASLVPPYLNHHFVEYDGGGFPPPPRHPPATFFDFLQRFNCTPILQTSLGGLPPPPNPLATC